MHYPCSENKGADQLRGSAALFSPMPIVVFLMHRLIWNQSQIQNGTKVENKVSSFIQIL